MASTQLPRRCCTQCTPLLLLALFLGLIVANPVAAEATAAPASLAASLSPRTQPVAAGKPVTLSVAFSRPPERTALPTSAFKVSHERLLHLVGIGQDLDTFMHWHPTASTPTAFTFANVTFPKAGTYLIALDAQLAEGSKDVATQTKLSVGGSPRMGPAAAGQSSSVAVEAGPAASAAGTSITVRSSPLKPQQPAVSLASLAVKPNSAGANIGSGGGPLYTATVARPQGAACKPGKAATYVWTLYHGSSSKGGVTPVTDLRLYYGAPMHLAVVKSDLSFIAHEHGDVVTPGSSNKPASASPPDAGAPAAADEHTGHNGRRLQQHNMLSSTDKLHAATNYRRRVQQHENHGAANSQAAGSSSSSSMGGSDMGGMMMGGHDMINMMNMGGGGSSKAGGFGAAIKTTITFPSAGRYLLVGQVARGGELILLPVYVSCFG